MRNYHLGQIVTATLLSVLFTMPAMADLKLATSKN